MPATPPHAKMAGEGFEGAAIELLRSPRGFISAAVEEAGAGHMFYRLPPPARHDTIMRSWFAGCTAMRMTIYIRRFIIIYDEGAAWRRASEVFARA